MLKIASIGSGGRGRLCKFTHRPEKGSKLVAMCDSNPAVRESYAAEFPGIACFTDYKELLAADKYDAIFVTTPDFLHEEHALAALKTGAAIYLEKPMAITIEGCDKILAYEPKVYLGHNMRFFPVIQKMKQVIDSGRIGKVQAIWCRHFIDYGGDAYFKDWHSEQKYTTGLLLQKGAHDIDVIHHLAGSHTKRVVGMGKLSVYNEVKARRAANEPGNAKFVIENWPPEKQTGLSPNIDVEDHSMILMQLENGVQASYSQCHYTPDGWRNYTVIGTHGRIENFGDHTSEKLTSVVRVYDQRTGGFHNGNEEIIVKLAEGSHGGADPLIIDDFLNFTRTGKRNGATPWDARQSVAAGVLGSKSIRNGNMPYDVPPQGK